MLSSYQTGAVAARPIAAVSTIRQRALLTAVFIALLLQEKKKKRTHMQSHCILTTLIHFFMSLTTGLEVSALTGVTLMQIHMCCSCNNKWCILTHHPGSTVTLLSHLYIPIATFCSLKELPRDTTLSLTYRTENVIIHDGCVYV